MGSSSKLFKSNVFSKSYLSRFSFINLSKLPVLLVSSQAKISDFNKLSYYLIDRSLKFPIGVGIIINFPLAFFYSISI